MRKYISFRSIFRRGTSQRTKTVTDKLQISSESDRLSAKLMSISTPIEKTMINKQEPSILVENDTTNHQISNVSEQLDNQVD